MAQEIQQTVGVSVLNGDLKLPRIGTTNRINQTTKGGGVPGLVVAISTGQGTAVSTTGLSTPGVTYIKNIDPSITVNYGPLVSGTMHPFGQLKPGEEATFRCPNAWNIKGVSGSPKCLVQILDD